MILESPHYEGLSIYVGEKPIAGSFYVPKISDTLAFMANWAYGSGTLPFVLRINKSPWNMANCVYRKSSTKCYTSKVDSGLALSQNSFADGAWIALCQGDKQSWASSLGLNYPVIWIPGPNGEEPEDLKENPSAPLPKGKLELPDQPGIPSASFTAPSNGEPGSATFVGPGDPGESPDPAELQEQESGSPWPWVFGIGGGALVIGLIWYSSRKKKQGGGA